MTAGSLDAASGTRPWVTLVAVLATLLAGLIFLVAFAMAAMMAIGGGMSEELGIGGGIGAAVVVFLLYGLMGLLYAAIAWRLWRIRKSIVAFVAGAGSATLEDMLRAHASFWRLIGILALVVICIYGVTFLLVVGLGVVGGIAGASG